MSDTSRFATDAPPTSPSSPAADDGTPASLAPHERRISGRWFLLILAILAVAFVATALFLTRFI